MEIVQPFTEVSCSKVAASVSSALEGEGFPRADVLFGRALGRVLAHEQVHVLTGSEVHGGGGGQRAALSGKVSPPARCYLAQWISRASGKLGNSPDPVPAAEAEVGR